MEEFLMNKYFVAYEDYGKLINILIDKLLNLRNIDKLNYDYVYGPSRGGLPIATHIAHHTNVDIILDLDSFLTKIPVNECPTIIICDDVCDSGKTFIDISKKLKKYQVTPIYCSLFFKQRSIFNPNLMVKIMPNSTWVVFPWELDNVADKKYMYGNHE